MKKKITLIISLALSVIILLAPAVNAESADYIFTKNDDGFRVTITAGDGSSVSPWDKIVILACKDGENLNISKTSILQSVYFDAQTVAENGKYDFLCSFDTNNQVKYPYGQYDICVFHTNNHGETDNMLFKYIYISPAVKTQFLERFTTLDAADLAESVSYYTETEPVFFLDEAELVGVNISELGKMFVNVRKLFLSGKLGGNKINEFKTVEDVSSMLKLAYNLKNLYEGSVREENFDRIICPTFFDERVSFSRFSTIFNALKDGSDEADDIYTKIRKSCALAQIYGGTTKTIKDSLQNHSEELDLDLSYAKENGVSCSEIAAYISSNDVLKYANGFTMQVNDIVNQIVKQKESNHGGYSGGASGGRGGGGSGINGVLVRELGELHPSSNSDTILTQPNESADKFTDMAGFEWALDAVNALYDRNILAGVGGNLFEPEREVTREEFVKMLVMAFKLTGKYDDEFVFEDCTMQDWFYPYIRIAYEYGVTNGVSETLFGVGEPIKRCDMTVMAMELMSNKAGESQITFADADAIPEYAYKSIAMAVKSGAITGFEDNTFRPKKTATRAEASVIIYRLLNVLEGSM